LRKDDNSNVVTLEVFSFQFEALNEIKGEKTHTHTHTTERERETLVVFLQFKAYEEKSERFRDRNGDINADRERGREGETEKGTERMRERQRDRNIKE
jgi:hypothetical protein